MNLFKTFKTNSTLESDGIWLEYGQNSKGQPIRIRIARAGGSNVRFAKVMERLTRPHKKSLELGVLDNAVAQKLFQDGYAEAVVLDWEGVEDENDQPIPFSKEAVVKLFQDLPDLFRDIKEQADNSMLFREHLRSSDLGNSGTSLSTDSSKEE